MTQREGPRAGCRVESPQTVRSVASLAHRPRRPLPGKLWLS